MYIFYICINICRYMCGKKRSRGKQAFVVADVNETHSQSLSHGETSRLYGENWLFNSRGPATTLFSFSLHPFTPSCANARSIFFLFSCVLLLLHFVPSFHPPLVKTYEARYDKVQINLNPNVSLCVCYFQ